MNINHGLLSAVGVSSLPLERLVYAARMAGALGAKLTGAGGGGCMVALTEAGGLGKVARAIEEAGGEAFTATTAKEGVRIEEER
ncbi:mevalonate kinase, partial [Candidatus Bathyarchaeota archaeon]